MENYDKLKHKQKSRIAKSGSSLGVHIPKEICVLMGFQKEDEIIMQVEELPKGLVLSIFKEKKE